MSDGRQTRKGVLFPRAAVSSETLQGEAIIINHDNGSYFNSVGSGAVIWEMIEKGASPKEIAERLSSSYAIASDAATASISAFLEELDRWELIERRDTGSLAYPWPSVTAKEPFSPPVIERHSDLNDLLMLDPIHEVEPEAGWPVRL